MNCLSRLTIFVGSFLLFGVQPMVGSTLLPLFGGTAAVWTTCLATFQVLLLAGYGYAHLIGNQNRINTKRSQKYHLALMVVSIIILLAATQVRPFLMQWFGTQGFPVLSVLLCVLLLIGVPYTLLSANASLVQAWVSQREGKHADVYHLYAFSNAGSLGGLFCYPLLIEPFITLTTQWYGLAVLLGVYVVLLAVLARKTWSVGQGVDATESEKAHDTFVLPYDGATSLLWLLLPATSTFVLNAVTAHLSNDLTPLPLLWVVILALFLLSYVIGFTATGLKLLSILPYILIPILLWVAWQWGLPTSGHGFVFHILAGFLLVFLGGILLHAWLYRIRPSGCALTRYYLFIAIGGASGGVLSGILSPLVFNSIVEYPISIVLLFLAILWIATGQVKEIEFKVIPKVWAGLLMGSLLLILLIQSSNLEGRTLFRMRNFYGSGRISTKTYEVKGVVGQNFQANVFEHSGTVHGFQILGALQEEPTLCFTHQAGGLSITRHPLYGTTNSMRVAVAGMGIGTLATYGRAGDVYRFYEVNPQVATVATNAELFTFISNCRADVSIVVDDARRALEAERMRNESKWDVLIIDVYSGDAIPQHMSTREAFELYLDRLAPDGILAIHLTNWHLNLSPMVKAAAREFNLHLQGFGCWADKYSMGTYWTFLTRKPMELYIEGKHGKVDYSRVKDMQLMTDERHSLLPYLSLDPMPAFDGRNETDKAIRPVK